MSEPKSTGMPRAMIIVGAVLFIAGAVLGGWMIARMVSWVGGIEDSPRFVAPGSITVDFPEAGAFGVYAEQYSEVDGVAQTSTLAASALEISVRDAAGDTVAYESVMNSMNFTYETGAYSGELIGRFTLDAPGSVTLTAQAAQNAGSGTTVLAIGEDPRDMVGGIMTMIVGSCGGGALVLGGLVAAVVGIILLVNRRRAG